METYSISIHTRELSRSHKLANVLSMLVSNHGFFIKARLRYQPSTWLARPWNGFRLVPLTLAGIRLSKNEAFSSEAVFTVVCEWTPFVWFKDQTLACVARIDPMRFTRTGYFVIGSDYHANNSSKAAYAPLKSCLWGSPGRDTETKRPLKVCH